MPKGRRSCHDASVAYFTAVIGRSGSRWRALDVDLEELETLDEVGEQLRFVGNGGPVVAVIEREDEWFALVRVDGDDEPRAFVSDLDAAESSRYGDLLAPVGDVELVEYESLRAPAPVASTAGSAGLDEESDLDEGPAPEPQDPEAVPEDDMLPSGADGDVVAAGRHVPPPWAGDPSLLADVGVPPGELVELVMAGQGDPASVVADLGERCGFDELLDMLR
jgi:putative tRNA adenosine deaminase-associated protein